MLEIMYVPSLFKELTKSFISFAMSLWGRLRTVRPSRLCLDQSHSVLKIMPPIMTDPNGVITAVLMEIMIIMISILLLIILLM